MPDEVRMSKENGKRGIRKRKGPVGEYLMDYLYSSTRKFTRRETARNHINHHSERDSLLLNTNGKDSRLHP